MHPDLVPYHLTCDQPSLMPDLGPPDFYPLIPVRACLAGGLLLGDFQPQPYKYLYTTAAAHACTAWFLQQMDGSEFLLRTKGSFYTVTATAGHAVASIAEH